MPINLTPWFILWAIATTAVVALFVARVMVAKEEPAGLHVAPENDAQMEEVTQEAKLAQKLNVIDRWGKLLTAVSAVLVLFLGAAWLYNGFFTAGLK